MPTSACDSVTPCRVIKFRRAASTSQYPSICSINCLSDSDRRWRGWIITTNATFVGIPAATLLNRLQSVLTRSLASVARLTSETLLASFHWHVHPCDLSESSWRSFSRHGASLAYLSESDHAASCCCAIKKSSHSSPVVVHLFSLPNAPKHIVVIV